MSVGALDIVVSANFARFASDMGKVASIAEENAKKIDNVFGVVGTALKAIGAGAAIGFSLEAVKGKIEAAIQSAAGLKELAERTGATVESLSGLAAVAKLSGTDTDQLATGLQKLSKALLDAETGGKKTQSAFAAIGISTKELVGLKPDDAFLLISNRLATYADGAEKTAIAQALLGKAGANLLPVMADLATTGAYVTKTTTEQAEAALEYEKDLKRLEAATNSIYKAIGFQLVPVLDAFTKALITTASGTDSLKSGVDALAKDNAIQEWAESAAKFVGFVVDAFQGVVSTVQIVGRYLGATAAAVDVVLDAKGTKARAEGLAQIRKELISDIDEITAKTQFSVKLQEQLDALHRKQADPAKAEAARPTPKFDPNAGNKGDPTKAYFDSVLKTEDAFIAAEKALLASREGQLDYYRGLDYLTLRQVEEKKQALIAASLTTRLAAYDKEAAAAAIAAAKADTQQKKQEFRNAGIEIQKKRAADIVASNAAIGASVERLDAVQRQFDLATNERQRQAGIENATQQFNIDMLGRNTLEVQKANAERRIELDLQERIYQLRKLDPTADVSAAIAQAEKQKAAALDLTEQAYNKQRDAAFGAQEAFRKYAEEAGNAGAQVENLLTNAFKGAEDALVEFAKTGKLNFKALADSIIADLIRMQVRAAIGSAFGGGGGLVGLLGSFFGSSASTSGVGASAADAAGSTIFAASGTNYVEKDGQHAILHKGEAVVPAAYNPAAGGHAQGVNVQVINNHGGAQVSTNQLDDGTIQLIIDQAAEKGAKLGEQRSAANLAAGRGPHYQALRTRGVNLNGNLPRRT